ncbi:MICOS complex subunit Mic60 [Bombyx mori]|uniref:MICOS complex subunit MIC60 n=1 Tax=Bombyx mori TaxID=7091 RepID=A0A8R2R9C2_BOMMO|nr:MICOS complex subunit Mic60 isoform X2 [Bombyx mori]
MIRIAQHGVNIRTILRRHRPLQLQGSHLHQCTSLYKYIDPRERPPCPPPPVPPPPAPRDYKLFWGAMTALVLAGGFAAYAKTSPEVRDWLTINAPWFDDVIAVAYQENMTYKEFILQCTEDAKKYLNSYVRDDKPKQCSFEEGSALSNVELPDQPADQALREKENESPCDTLPPPVVTKDVCEIEKCLTDLADTALNNYGTARDACAYYNKLVEETMLDFSMSSLGELRHAMLERQDLVKTSVDNANYAVSRLDELTRYFECGVQAPKESLDNTKALLKDYRDKIQTTSANYQWENDRSLAMDKQWQMVGEVVEKYSAETQQMFPAPRRGQTDTDLLLIHATRYMQQLEGEVREARAAMSARVARGLLTLPQDEQQRSGREALVQAAVRRRRTEMDREYRKRSEELRAANEHMISECLKRQRAEHEETLRQRVLQKEIEAKARLNKLIAEKVAAEKLVLAAQLAEMRSKLNVVEEKLNERLRAERCVRRARALWAAGGALLAATRAPHAAPLAALLRDVQDAAGEDDEFVRTVLKSIPDYVRDEGIELESVLRKKYYEMEKVALKVALVEEDGAPLFVYFLSWLQYMLLFVKISGIPQAEYESSTDVLPEDLDTFDLLQRARFWLEHGSCERAVRCVRGVRGAAGAAAGRWARRAGGLLAVRAAAHAVRAHAAHLALQYV